ncbi:putative epimerase [Bacillus sp. TS-2]|nr:putative epimerase [Bacillus sp. TS-2]
MSKKIVSLFLVLMVTFTTLGLSAKASPQLDEPVNTTQVNDGSGDIGVQNYNGAWLKALWYFTNKAGNYIFTRSPKAGAGVNADYVSSGDFSFNNGNNGAHGRHTAYLGKSKHELVAFAQTHPVNWPGKISIIVTNPRNSDVVSKTVSHNGQVYYKGGVLGNYTVRYVQNKKQKWDLWLYVYHYENRVCTGCTPSSNVVTLANHEGKEFNAQQTNNGIYITPSKSHKSHKSSTSLSKSTYSYLDLVRETFDQELNESVHQFKSLSLGDTINFKDLIASIEYDKNEDETYIGFKSDDEGNIIEWAFSNDLTKKYNVGDTLDLQFKIVQLADDTKTFETLNYIKYGIDSKGKAPKIDNYLK